MKADRKTPQLFRGIAPGGGAADGNSEEQECPRHLDWENLELIESALSPLTACTMAACGLCHRDGGVRGTPGVCVGDFPTFPLSPLEKQISLLII